MDEFDELYHRFQYHPATPEKGATHQFLRQECHDLAVTFRDELPDSREKSLALTKVEEAMFWANAAIARALED